MIAIIEITIYCFTENPLAPAFIKILSFKVPFLLNNATIKNIKKERIMYPTSW